MPIRDLDTGESFLASNGSLEAFLKKNLNKNIVRD